MPRGGFTGHRASAPIGPPARVGNTARLPETLGLFDVELQDAGPQTPLNLFDDDEEGNDVEGEEGERYNTMRDRASPTHDQEGRVYIQLRDGE